MKWWPNLLLAFVIVGAFQPSFAQNNGQLRIDSLNRVLSSAKSDTLKVKLLVELVRTCLESKQDGEPFGKQAIQLATLCGWKKGIADANSAMGTYYFKKSFLRALSYDSAALQQYKAIGDKQGMLEVIRIMGIIFHITGKYGLAEQYFAEGMRIAEETGDKKWMLSFSGNNGYINMTKKDYPKALVFFERARQIAESMKDTVSLAGRIFDIGTVYEAQYNYTRALEFFNMALKINTESSNLNGIAGVEEKIGTLYLSIDSSEALAHFDNAMKIYEQTGETEALAWLFWKETAPIYIVRNDTAKVLDRYQQAFRLYEKSGNKGNAAAVISSIGNLYKSTGDYTRALGWYYKSAEMHRINGYTSGQAVVEGYIGDVFLMANQSDSALAHLLKSKIIYEQLGEKEGIALALLALGKANLNIATDGAFNDAVAIKAGKGRYLGKAVDDLETGQSLCREAGERDKLKDFYEYLSIGWRLSGDYKKALDYRLRYEALKDSLFLNENREKMVQAIVKNEFEQKQSAAKQKADDELKLVAASLKLQRSYTYLGVGVILVLLLFSVFVFRSNRVQKRLNDRISKLVNEQAQTIEARTRELAHTNDQLAESNANLVQSNNRLDQTNQKLVELIRYNAHNLREPLTRISGAMSIREYVTDQEFNSDIWPQMLKAVADLDTSIKDVVLIAEDTVAGTSHARKPNIV